MREAVAPDKPITKSFNELVQAVKDKLDPIPGVYAGAAAFFGRTQQPSESVATFITKVDSHLHGQLLIGMADSETLRGVLRVRKLSLKDLYWAAVLSETVLAQSKLLDMRAAAAFEPTVQRQTGVGEVALKGTPQTPADSRTCSAIVVARKDMPGKHVAAICPVGPPTVTQAARGFQEYFPSRKNSACQLNVVSAGGLDLRICCGHLNANSSIRPTVTLTVMVDGVTIEFEVDSGSALTLISEKAFYKLWKGRPLQLRKSKLEVKTRLTKCTLELHATRNGGQPLWVDHGSGRST
ncbi:hypothetical protein TTRE_0000787601 [Trichuris trichiura]|uniref:Peptidase A2 domain-containing protein n=1 Tax=Trichuris trichiura TaxID=36087 RepID=A0A077ZLK6_TRITR|nr:hypothetical protein TTRE_0000787601 [Trichuris trichiura]